MSDNRRSDFLRRVSSVGWGTREAIQVILGRVVADLREGIARDQFGDDVLDEVIAFHDETETLWQSSIATNPPIDRHELTKRLERLLEVTRSPVLGEFERRLERGVRLAEEFEKKDD